MLLNSDKTNLGWKAKDFKLLSTNGDFKSLDDIFLQNGMVIAFICNHCPYVKDIIGRVVKDFTFLNKLKVGTVAIMPNDTNKYPEDSFDNMKLFSLNNKFSFPYLLDRNQTVAKDYQAICTPDFFCFNEEKRLFYRGRLDNIKYQENKTKRLPELLNAFKKMINIKKIEENQHNSIGCSIKWK